MDHLKVGLDMEGAKFDYFDEAHASALLKLLDALDDDDDVQNVASNFVFRMM